MASDSFIGDSADTPADDSGAAPAGVIGQIVATAAAPRAKVKASLKRFITISPVELYCARNRFEQFRSLART
jgi:hypothetical protein